MDQGNNQEIEQNLCYVCFINEADPEIVSDIKICNECYLRTSKMMREFKEKRYLLGKKNVEISEIIKDKLYLGNEDAASSKKELEERGITHILVAGSQLDQYFEQDYTYLQLELADSVNQKLSNFFNISNQFIENGNVVYVHCAAGVSRSASLVIAYIMKKNQWTFEQAFEFVKSKRSVICPNSSFRSQLKEYEALILQSTQQENSQIE